MPEPRSEPPQESDLASTIQSTPASNPSPLISAADLPHVLLRAIEAAGHGITIADATSDQPLVYANSSFLAMTGYTMDQVLGRNCRFLQGPDTDPHAVDTLAQAVHDGADTTVVLRNYRSDGSTFWNEVSVSAVGGPTTKEITHFIGTQTDVTERIERERELAERATTDSLTGLVNLEQLGVRLAAIIDSISRDDPPDGVTIVTIDLVDFHLVNENLDFDTGNLVLTAVADRLASSTSQGDVLSRLGSDHFAVVRRVRKGESSAAAGKIIDAVGQALAEPIKLYGLTIPVRAACGAANYPDDGTTAMDLIRASAAALEQYRSDTDRSHHR